MRGASHLPPGHQPGRQTRRVARSAPVAPILIGLLSLAALAAAVALYAGRGSGSRSGHLIGAGVFAGLAVLGLAGAWYLYWRVIRGGPRAKGIEVQVARTEWRRGEEVAAVVNVDWSAVGEDQLQVGLVCTCFHDVKRQTVDQNGVSHDVRATEAVDLLADWRNVAAGAAGASFGFRLAADGPFSYEGDTVSLAFRLRVRVPRKLRADPHRDVAIWVRP